MVFGMRLQVPGSGFPVEGKGNHGDPIRICHQTAFALFVDSMISSGVYSDEWGS
jgi:hypothetical protein